MFAKQTQKYLHAKESKPFVFFPFLPGGFSAIVYEDEDEDEEVISEMFVIFLRV